MQPKDAVLDYKTSIKSLINDNDVTIKLYQLKRIGLNAVFVFIILPRYKTTNDIFVNP